MSIQETGFYLLINALRVYIMYRFSRLFFDGSSRKKCLPFVYLAFYAANSAGYVAFDNATVNLAINVGGLLLVILSGYQGNLWKKLLTVAASYGINLLTEDMAWVIFVKGKSGQMAEFGFFFSVFILFLMEILIEKTVRLHKSIDIPSYKDLLLVMVSMGSMFVCVTLIEGTYGNLLLLIISLCVLLTVNIAVFYLYENMLDDYARQKEEELYRLQLAMYQNQLQVMQSANDAYRVMRHDIKHHAFMVSDYIRKNENEKALRYLDKINAYAGSTNQYVQTGNESIDSIFNYFIDKVNKSGGRMKTDIKVAGEMGIDDFDANVILSNLLFNACEAVSRSEKKEIRAGLKYDRGLLIIKIRNTYNGVLKQKEGKLATTKPEGSRHGIGLESVKRTVEKYHGEVWITYTEEEFTVKVLMYV